MSRPVPELLRELKDDVRNLEVLPAAAVRARGRSRGRRQMAALTVAGAVVATTAGLAVGWPSPKNDLPAGGPGLACVVALPDDPAQVHVRVLGASAGLTVSELRARRFTAQEGTTALDPERETALVYGPAAIGAAHLLRAAVHGEVVMRFDPDRRDDTVDLSLGFTFTRLATTTELNQNLVRAGEPTAPPGCG